MNNEEDFGVPAPIANEVPAPEPVQLPPTAQAVPTAPKLGLLSTGNTPQEQIAEDFAEANPEPAQEALKELRDEGKVDQETLEEAEQLTDDSKTNDEINNSKWNFDNSAFDEFVRKSTEALKKGKEEPVEFNVDAGWKGSEDDSEVGVEETSKRARDWETWSNGKRTKEEQRKYYEDRLKNSKDWKIGQYNSRIPLLDLLSEDEFEDPEFVREAIERTKHLDISRRSAKSKLKGLDLEASNEVRRNKLREAMKPIVDDLRKEYLFKKNRELEEQAARRIEFEQDEAGITIDPVTGETIYDDPSKEWAGQQILNTRQGMLNEAPDMVDAEARYNAMSDAAMDLYGFNEDIPLTREQEKALKEENKRQNAIDKEEFRQASNEALINVRNKFGRYYEDYKDSKWAERIEQMVNMADAELKWQDQIDTRSDDIDKPFKDTPARVAFAELKEDLDKDIEISPEEKKQVKSILDDLEIAFGKGMPGPNVVEQQDMREAELDKKSRMAGSSFKGLTPIIAKGGGISPAHGAHISNKASKANAKAANHSGAAKVANDVTAVKEYKNTKLLKGQGSASQKNSFNLRNGGSIRSSGVQKSKGGRLLSRVSKLPNGGGHTSNGTGKLGLPNRKASQNLTLASLKSRIISASQSWPEKNGFRDSEDRLGSIQLLVKGTDVWVGSGVTKGRIKLENALEKEPQLDKLILTKLS